MSLLGAALFPALTFLLGLAVAFFVLRLLRPPAPPPPPTADIAELVEIVRRASHDLRGAVSPALLMAERLEAHADPEVRTAAAVVAEALDRASAISRATSAAVKRFITPPNPGT